MKKAPFRDHCILVKIHFYNQPSNTFSEQMLLSDLDRQKLAGKSQKGMVRNNKNGRSDKIVVGMKSYWLNSKVDGRIEKFSVELKNSR